MNPNFTPHNNTEALLLEIAKNSKSSGGADWNASEGEAGYVKNRPFWIEKAKSPLPFGEITVTTSIMDGHNGASCMAMIFPGSTYIVVFDGAEYECEVRYSEEYGVNYIGSFDFSDYPFVIFNNTIFTQTAGEHTFEQFDVGSIVKANYAPTMVFETQKNNDRTPYLDIETAKNIVNAYNNGVPVRLFSNYGVLGITMNVTECTEDFITASYTGKGGYGTVEHIVYMFSVNSGELYSKAHNISGTIKDNDTNFPLLYINNQYYKITVGENGALTATLHNA